MQLDGATLFHVRGVSSLPAEARARVIQERLAAVVGYVVFEISSNLLLERIGARKTFARITILWGLTSMATMLVKTAAWFYLLRFLLGAFESGLLPGTVLYLTYWFPNRRRGNPTVGFWGPTIIEGLGIKDARTIGFLFAVPNLLAVISLVVVSRHSDRTLERRYHSALPCLASRS